MALRADERNRVACLKRRRGRDWPPDANGWFVRCCCLRRAAAAAVRSRDKAKEHVRRLTERQAALQHASGAQARHRPAPRTHPHYPPTWPNPRAVT